MHVAYGNFYLFSEEWPSLSAAGVVSRNGASSCLLTTWRPRLQVYRGALATPCLGCHVAVWRTVLDKEFKN